MECTNGDKWNCKYCRKVESCEANKAGTTVSPPITVGLGDSERLEWLMRNVSGKEFRRLGVTYGGNCGRDRIDAAMKVSAGDTARPPTPTGWSDTDWLKHLQEQQHPLAGLHINQGSMDAAADAYEAEYNARHNVELTGRAAPDR